MISLCARVHCLRGGKAIFNFFLTLVFCVGIVYLTGVFALHIWGTKPMLEQWFQLPLRVIGL